MPLIDCAYCRGTARVRKSEFTENICPICKGKGQIEAPPQDERVECRFCKSSGSVKISVFSRKPCNVCGGVGYMHLPEVTSEEKSLEVYHLKGDKPYSDRRDLEEILKSLNGDVRICETYISEDTLDLLRCVSSTCHVKVLMGPRINLKKISKKIALFKKEYSNFSFKQYNTSGLHDRYVIDDNSLIILGYGLQRAGIDKESFAIILNNEWIENIKDGVISEFDKKWDSGNAKAQ